MSLYKKRKTIMICKNQKKKNMTKQTRPRSLKKTWKMTAKKAKTVS